MPEIQEWLKQKIFKLGFHIVSKHEKIVTIISTV